MHFGSIDLLGFSLFENTRQAQKTPAKKWNNAVVQFLIASAPKLCGMDVRYGWILFRLIKKHFYQQVLKLGANDASAQGLQNAL